MKRLWLVSVLGVLLAACAPSATVPPLLIPTPTPLVLPATATPDLVAGGVWISPAVPDSLRNVAQGWGIATNADAKLASLRLDVQSSSQGAVSQWIYALVAPFPTVLDGVTSDELKAVWKGSSPESFGKWPLLMTESTLATFTAVWGAPGITVRVTPEVCHRRIAVNTPSGGV